MAQVRVEVNSLLFRGSVWSAHILPFLGTHPLFRGSDDLVGQSGPAVCSGAGALDLAAVCTIPRNRN